MSQSNAIFFFLLAGFVIYITMRGKLPTYAGFLLATPNAAPATAASSPASGNGTDAVAAAADVAKVAAVLL